MCHSPGARRARGPAPRCSHVARPGRRFYHPFEQLSLGSGGHFQYRPLAAPRPRAAWDPSVCPSPSFSLLEAGQRRVLGVFAVTRAARRRDRSGVASAGCPLIPRDGTARTGMQGGFGIRVSCGPLLSLPRWDFSPAVFPGRCAVVDGSAPGKGRRERVGFVLNAWCSGIR